MFSNMQMFSTMNIRRVKEVKANNFYFFSENFDFSTSTTMAMCSS